MSSARQVDLFKAAERDLELLRTFSMPQVGHRSCLIGFALVEDARIIITKVMGVAIANVHQKGSGGRPYYIKWADGAYRIRVPGESPDPRCNRVSISECLEERPEGHVLVQVEVFTGMFLPVAGGPEEGLQVPPFYSYRVYDHERKFWSALNPDHMHPTNGPPLVIPIPAGSGLDEQTHEVTIKQMRAAGVILVDPHWWVKKNWAPAAMLENKIMMDAVPTNSEEALRDSSRGFLFGWQQAFQEKLDKAEEYGLSEEDNAAELAALRSQEYKTKKIATANEMLAYYRGAVLAEAEQRRKLEASRKQEETAMDEAMLPESSTPVHEKTAIAEE
jgi:hypothetical protein